ncbi:hypothetical protein SZ55_2334 [Pseudomonas sp. FeS53a]|nr:hypothetical protein SZ55_2334 [Pseudomonas sp. FeS53a]
MLWLAVSRKGHANRENTTTILISAYAAPQARGASVTQYRVR